MKLPATNQRPKRKVLDKIIKLQKLVNAGKVDEINELIKNQLSFYLDSHNEARNRLKTLETAPISHFRRKPETLLIKDISEASTARFCDKFKNSTSLINRNLLFVKSLDMPKLLMCAIIKVAQLTKVSQNKLFIFSVFMRLTGRSLKSARYNFYRAVKLGVIRYDPAAQAVTVSKVYRLARGRQFFTVKNIHLINGGNAEFTALKVYSNALLNSISKISSEGINEVAHGLSDKVHRFTMVDKKLLLNGVSTVTNGELLRRVLSRNIKVLQKMGLVCSGEMVNPSGFPHYRRAAGGFIYCPAPVFYTVRVLCLRLVRYVGGGVKRHAERVWERCKKYFFRLKSYVYQKLKQGKRGKYEPPIDLEATEKPPDYINGS